MNRREGEAGFTLVTTLLGLTLASLLTVVAVSAVRGNVNLTSNNLNQQRAYEAAKAGVNDYVYHLHEDNAYWRKCTDVEPPNNAVNQEGSTAKRRAVPGMTGAQYAIELLPASTSTYSECDPDHAKESMIETTGSMPGTFRIRSTGFAGDSEAAIVATFKPSSFLNYVYFTQLETSDPVTYGYESGSTQAEGVNTQCQKSIRDGRYEAPIPGTEEIRWGKPVAGTGRYCDTISFKTGDAINGPMHTNDAFVMCGNPTLGKTANDPVEVSSPPKGWYSTRDIPSSGSSCTGTPNFAGTFVTGSPEILPPASNGELKMLAEAPNFKRQGQVRICLSGQSMTMGTGSTCEGAYSGPLPANGIVYVENGVCGTIYSPFTATYPTSSGCGNVFVKGNYSGQLTIAAENDIIVNGNLIHSGEGVLGLVANNFVRIYHPFSSDSTSSQTGPGSCNSGSNGSGSITDLRIDAAILAIAHSFIVDHYDCGKGLGTLTVNGAIAQKYRGAVGTTGGAGYKKDYNYDERLSYLQPPSFLAPVQAEWLLGRETRE